VSNSSSPSPLRFVQIGDLHLTGQGMQNHRDFICIVHELNRHVGGSVDFVYLPVDNADDGTDDQFGLVRGGLDELRFHGVRFPEITTSSPIARKLLCGLRVPKLPAGEIRGYLYLFLDVVSRGAGGPGFRLGATQFDWLRGLEAHCDGKACVVFMNAYPADLGEEAERLSRLLDASSVRPSPWVKRITTRSRMTGAPSPPRRVRPDKSRKDRSVLASRRSTAMS
jgi:3',5'-cyclic-AMP phosphodiesterase